MIDIVESESFVEMRDKCSHKKFKKMMSIAKQHDWELIDYTIITREGLFCNFDKDSHIEKVVESIDDDCDFNIHVVFHKRGRSWQSTLL